MRGKTQVCVVLGFHAVHTQMQKWRSLLVAQNSSNVCLYAKSITAVSALVRVLNSVGRKGCTVAHLHIVLAQRPQSASHSTPQLVLAAVLLLLRTVWFPRFSVPETSECKTTKMQYPDDNDWSFRSTMKHAITCAQFVLCDQRVKNTNLLVLELFTSAGSRPTWIRDDVTAPALKCKPRMRQNGEGARWQEARGGWAAHAAHSRTRRAQELCESRGGRLAPVPNKPTVSQCGRKATLSYLVLVANKPWMNVTTHDTRSLFRWHSLIIETNSVRQYDQALLAEWAGSSNYAPTAIRPGWKGYRKSVARPGADSGERKKSLAAPAGDRLQLAPFHRTETNPAPPGSRCRRRQRRSWHFRNWLQPG